MATRLPNTRGYFHTRGYFGTTRLGKRVYPWCVYPPGTQVFSRRGAALLFEPARTSECCHSYLLTAIVMAFAGFPSPPPTPPSPPPPTPTSQPFRTGVPSDMGSCYDDEYYAVIVVWGLPHGRYNVNVGHRVRTSYAIVRAVFTQALIILVLSDAWQVTAHLKHPKRRGDGIRQELRRVLRYGVQVPTPERQNPNHFLRVDDTRQRLPSRFILILSKVRRARKGHASIAPVRAFQVTRKCHAPRLGVRHWHRVSDYLSIPASGGTHSPQRDRPCLYTYASC